MSDQAFIRRSIMRMIQHIFWALLAFILVSACGADQSQVGSVRNSHVPEQTTPSTAVRVVKHAIGETQVPESPHRVITLHTVHLGNALALGIKPIGTVGWYSNLTGIEPYKTQLEDLTGEFTFLGPYDQFNIEKILRLKPDLIIGFDYYETIYNELSQIAPTVLFQWDGNTPWKEAVRETGNALNQNEEVEQLFNQYNQRTQALNHKIQEEFTHLSVSVIDIDSSSMRFALKNSFLGSILQDIGASRPPSQDKDGIYDSFPVSLELIPQMDADVIFITTGQDQGSLDIVKQFKQHPLWSALEAVKQDRVYQVNPETWYGDNIITANLVLDDLYSFLFEKE
jgi:iron complex transport system substrate-binding protein